MAATQSSATAAAAPGHAPSGRRRTAARVLAALMAVSGIAFGIVTVVLGLVDEAQLPHVVHNTVVASLLLVISAPAAIAVARAPERSIGALVTLAVIGVAGLATMALSVTLDPFTLPFVVLVGVLWALRPTRERPLPAGRPSLVLLGMVAAAAAPLILYALGNASMQRTDVSDHARFFHWVETSFYAVAVLLLGLLAAIRPAAYRLAAWSAGVALAVLGAASLFLTGYPSALDTPSAAAALAGGIAFIGVAEWEARRARGSSAM